MKTETTEARKTLTINGDLLAAILEGATIIDHVFNGWDWYILIKRTPAQAAQTGFQYAQYETMENINDMTFYLMRELNGTKNQVIKMFRKDYHEVRAMKNRAFELGNIK